MINRLRRWLSFKQRNRDILVSNRHPVFEFELLPQTQRALEKICALLRIAHSQAKVANFSNREWNLHLVRELRGLFPVGTVARNERFHEAQVEIFQGITRCLAQAACASLQLGPDIDKPDAANHSKFGTQLCGRTAWMRFQEIFHVLSDYRRQFVD